MRLADTLVLEKKFDEAREVLEAALPVALRVLGPDHHITQILSDPVFLDPYPKTWGG